MRVGNVDDCVERYSGRMMGMNAQQILDGFHFLTAGVVSFARGLNDTPKILALLVGFYAVGLEWGSVVVGLAMAFGGFISSRKVANTMGFGITTMNAGQGFTANLVTACLVLGASRIGVPVSTTHVSCGSLFGMGMAIGNSHRKTILGIVLAWLVTLPLAMLLAGLAFLALS